MQNNNVKSQNTQIPSKGRTAQSITNLVPCLVIDHNGPCNHWNCNQAHKLPQYFGISFREWFDRYEFQAFEIKAYVGKPFIIPQNPNNGKDKYFEAFRQSMNSIVHLAGIWPDVVTSVPRSHIEFRWTEYVDTYLFTDRKTLKTTWKTRLDVQEFAYYVGPIKIDQDVKKGGNPCV